MSTDQHQQHNHLQPQQQQLQSASSDARGTPRNSTSEMNHLPLPKRLCVSPSRHPYIQKNLDIFKESFQKPSQIYRFLNEYWKKNPLFLTRNLSYVSKHRHRSIRNGSASIDLVAKKLMKDRNHCNSKHENSRPSRQSLGSHNYCNGASRNHCDSSNIISSTTQNANSIVGKHVVCYFNWICDDPGKTSQRTRSYGLLCPWCDRDYCFMESLIAHLQFCHPRFNFKLVEEDGQAVIEMTLNPSFDGSYCGFKYPGHNLRRDFRFTPKKPERRMPTTQIIFIKAKRRAYPQNGLSQLKMRPDGDTYLYDDGEADIDVCSGRLYYHTSTCLPVKPNEVDLDSEADIDPDWLRERTQLMIDEFTDVNEGEKEVLKLWNLHIMRNYKYKGDSMIRQACFEFIESEGPTLIAKNLTRNFTLHLVNLYEFGLIGSGDIIECVRKLRKLRPPIPSSPTKTTGRIKSERNSNEHCQHSSPAKRALLNSQCN